jgi:hypothetical protein
MSGLTLCVLNRENKNVDDCKNDNADTENNITGRQTFINVFFVGKFHRVFASQTTLISSKQEH